MSDTDPYLEIRQQVLAKALPNVAFEGWSQKLLDDAICEADVDEHMAVLAFPQGVRDLITAFSAQGDAAMHATLPEVDGLKIRERITQAVWARLMCDSEHREAVRRAVGWLSLPSRQKLAAELLFESANQMWRWAGDTSTDYNYYTKRLILSGVIASTRLIWLNDTSEGDANTRAFLERRIENVMQFEKAKAKARDCVQKNHGDKSPLDGIIAGLAKMRAGAAK